MTQESALTGHEERAARLVAEDELSDVDIAGRLRVSRASLARLKREPLFIARVEALRQEIAAAVSRYAIAKRVRRVAALDDRWRRMQALIEARAVEHAAISGGATGLLVRQVKQIGQGRDARIVEEYAADTGLLKELREHEKQAAQEVGQWSEKREVSGPNGGPIEVAASARERILGQLAGIAARSGEAGLPQQPE